MAYRPSKRPSISVVMTLRDADATLGRAVESVLAQSFTDVQLVLAVLPSGDGTLAHARRLEERDIRVDAVEVDEDASVDALDAGVDAARGEYLLFMGQRDWLGVHALALLAHAIEDGSVDLAVPVFSSANPLAPADAEEADRIVLLDRDQVRSQAHRFIVNDGFGTLHGKMLRRDRVQSLGIRHAIAGDDEAYLITYLEDLDSLAICPGAVYHDEGPLRIDGRTDPLARCEYDHQLMLELAERWGMADDRKLLEAVHLRHMRHLVECLERVCSLRTLSSIERTDRMRDMLEAPSTQESVEVLRSSSSARRELGLLFDSIARKSVPGCRLSLCISGVTRFPQLVLARGRAAVL